MKIVLENQDISDIVGAARFTETCLAESEVITLSGKRQIDRIGNFKAVLSFTVGTVRYSRWESISQLLKKLSIKVTVQLDGNAKTYDMCLDGELPTPYIFSAKDKDYCAGIDIVLKEVG